MSFEEIEPKHTPTKAESFDNLEWVIKKYFISSLSCRIPHFEEILNEESEQFFSCVDRISRASFFSKEDQSIMRCAALILVSSSFSNPESVRETALSFTDLLFSEQTKHPEARQKILACLEGHFNPEQVSPYPTMSEVFHDAVISLNARKKTKEYLVMKHSLQTKDAKERVAPIEWLEKELTRLKGLKFKTFAGQVHFSRKLYECISELQEIKASLCGTVTAEAAEKKILALYRSVSRNLIDMIAIADRKAGLLLSANAISLSLVISFIGNGMVSHPQLRIPAILVAGTCALTVLFASLAAQPIHRENSKVKLDQLIRSEEGVLYYGNAARLELNEFIRGFQMLMRDDEMLERGLLEELHFYSCRIVSKLRMVRRAYVTMFIGILLSFGAFLLSEYI